MGGRPYGEGRAGGRWKPDRLLEGWGRFTKTESIQEPIVKPITLYSNQKRKHLIRELWLKTQYRY